MSDAQLAQPPDYIYLDIADELSVDAVDRAVAGWHGQPFMFDLRELKTARASGLIYLAACISIMAKRETSFGLALPQDESLQHHLVTNCGLTRAIQVLARVPMTGGALREAPVRSAMELTRDKLALIELIKKPNPLSAVALTRKWSDLETHALLEHSLGDKAHLVAPGILYEALANAGMHPNAGIALMSASFHPGDEREPGSLEIAFWDDGQSIASTLQQGLAKVADEFDLSQFDIYQHRYWAEGLGDEGRAVWSGDVPSSQANTLELLLGSTFPGITRDPDRDAEQERPGMGLFVLTSLALDSFDGQLELRTGTANLVLERARTKEALDAECRYQARLTSQELEHFTGNLVVVRLPLLR